MRSHGNAKTNVYQRPIAHPPSPARAGPTPGRCGHRRERPDGGEVADAYTGCVGRMAPPARVGCRGALLVTRRGDVALRRTRATAWQISAALRVPRSTVTRVCGCGIKSGGGGEPYLPVQRYESAHAGDRSRRLKRLGRVIGIGHRIHGDGDHGSAGLAGNGCMSRSMTRPGSGTPKCWRPRMRRPAPRFCGDPGLVSPARRPDSPPAHRQRHGVSGAGVLRGLPDLGGPPALHTPLSPADKRQGRAVYPNAPA